MAKTKDQQEKKVGQKPSKNDTRKKQQQQIKKSQDDADVELNDSNEDEYDDEFGSEDKDFIASEDEVLREQEQAAKRDKKRLKREKKEERKHRRMQDESDPEALIDEEDLDLINENKSRPRKLRKLAAGDDQESADQDLEIPNNQEYTENSQYLKKEDLDRKRLVKKQIFEKSKQDFKINDEEMIQKNQVQSLKDKFVTEDIDDLFGTAYDLEIVKKDIPERLQIKIGERLNPNEQDIELEAEWIFNMIIDSLEKNQNLYQQKIVEIKQKICKVLKLFKIEMFDIPYIIRYRLYELSPELESKDIWKIFNLDIEYGKFQILKKQCDDFFQKLSEFGNVNQMEHYRNQIFYTKNQRDLNDFVPLMNFYKQYYHAELQAVQINSGKKLPVQKQEFIFNSRQRRLDEFSRRCMLNPIQLVENMQENKQLHKPNQPINIGPTDMAKEYIDQIIISAEGGRASEPLEVIKDMCVYTALELQSQPDIRRGFKRYIRDNGQIITEPTEKGIKELDIFHPSYRVKRVNKKLVELQDKNHRDLFLDILQNESLGLIKYQIVINDDAEEERIGNKYFKTMFDMFKYPDDSSKWRFLRREIFEIFSLQNTQTNKGQKSFLSNIIEEIKIELKEDAENEVINQCCSKYQDLINTGYFKIQNDQKYHQQGDIQKTRAIEEDIIPQRERLCVLGAVMYPIDSRNFQVTVAVVDKFGELVAHKDFLHILPSRKPRPRQDGAPIEHRPGEEEETRKHEQDKREFQQILRDHQVDLIVVSADCLEAKRLKKALSEFANLKNCQDKMQENDDEYQQLNNEDENINSQEALVIWGRPEIPKLFASSHYSQKLLKNHPFILKKSICLARFEQDPMNEILNLWSPIMSENQALQLNLHPLQKHINQARLVDALEQINIQMVNKVGIDINLLVDHEHWHNQLQFLSGLGPRKAQKYIQKLKQRPNPLYTRVEVYGENGNKILDKKCFISSIGFTKVRVPPEKRPDDLQFNILDQTRIHIRNYDDAYKLATDCLYDKQPEIESYKQCQAVTTIIKNPEKLKEFAMGEYKEQLKKIDKIGYGQLLDQLIEDLMHPFMDFREDKLIARTPNDQKFPKKDLFYCLIDETERTFRAGMIVSATVMKIYEGNGKPARILCKLENGLDASIAENDADFFPGGAQGERQIDQGSIVTGRVDSVNFGDKFANDDNYTIVLKCKQSDLRTHDRYLGQLGLGEDIEVPEEDRLNINFKVQEEQAQNQQKSKIQKRKIQHQRFQNITSTVAIGYLQKEDNGEFYFRPSSLGSDHLTLTWKFYEKNIVHIDITEHDKAIGANIGSKLRIADEYYENLQEIVERYIIPCNRSLREVTQHPKFSKTQISDELKASLEQEKQEDSSRIPYRFAVFDKYPQYVVLAYIPKNVMVKEYIKIKPRGYFFHHQYHYPFQNLINWFKQEFRTRDYQRYIRKTNSPQLLAGQTATKDQNQNQDRAHSGGMVIDSAANWGASRPDKIKNEGSRRDSTDWGQNGQKSNVKDEREKEAAGGWGGGESHPKNNGDGGWGGQANSGGDGNWGGSGGGGYQSPARSERSDRGGRGRGRGGERGRGRGGGDGGGGRYGFGDDGHMSRERPQGGRGGDRGAGGGNRACHTCGEEGHMSRECPNGGGGNAGGNMKCFSCGESGHMSRECPNPREKTGGNNRACFKCHQEGHMSRECPNPSSPDGGSKFKPRSRNCFNCQGEGHQARDCPEPRRERNDGDRPAYKRQRRDDDDGGYQSKNHNAGGGGGDGWGSKAAGGGQSDWGGNKNGAAGGWNTGSNGNSQGAKDNEGGWGAQNSQGTHEKQEKRNSSQTAGGWGNADDKPSSQNQGGGGWN